jgi:hypothetical protein
VETTKPGPAAVGAAVAAAGLLGYGLWCLFWYPIRHVPGPVTVDAALAAAVPTDDPTYRRHDPAPAPAKEAQTAWPAVPGEKTHLRDGDQPQIILGREQSDLDQLEKATRLGDQGAAPELAYGGGLFLVKAGTPALVLDMGGFLGGYRQVRVLGGEHAGEVGWVSSDSARQE